MIFIIPGKVIGDITFMTNNYGCQQHVCAMALKNCFNFIR
jgi:hypothetical protein